MSSIQVRGKGFSSDRKDLYKVVENLLVFITNELCVTNKICAFQWLLQVSIFRHKTTLLTYCILL